MRDEGGGRGKSEINVIVRLSLLPSISLHGAEIKEMVEEHYVRVNNESEEQKYFPTPTHTQR